MAVGSASLKALQTSLYSIAFGCSAVILALYSYFLAVQAQQGVQIPNKQRAVEGIGGSAVLYTILAIVFTCFIGGIPFFAFLGIVFDVLFAAGFIAIASMTHDGSGSCSAKDIKTPLGDGAPDSHKGRSGAQFSPSLHSACLMNKACYAVAILGIFVFLISAFVQVWLGRRHVRDKRYGPSPANDYTSGSGIRWFRRRGGARSAHAAAVKEAAPEGAFTRAGAANGGGGAGVGQRPSPYEREPPAVDNGPGRYSEVYQAGGYHTAPSGAAVNPYGYDRSGPTAQPTTEQIRSHNYVDV